MPALDSAPPDANALRALAEAAARAGGQIARRFFRTPLTVRFKADRSEVSDADEQAQAAIIAVLRSSRPHDSFLAEEVLPPAFPAPADRGVCWVIDPIDGTRNFVRGLPLYVTSVAALIDGHPVAGAIYEPERDAVYSATVRGPVLLNGVPRAVAATPAPAPATHAPLPSSERPSDRPRPLVAIPSRPTGPAAAMAHDWLERFICRNLGSTALHLALVATGDLDAMLADNPRLWDLAAGAVLIAAAGGVLTAPEGTPVFPQHPAAYRNEELPTIAARADLHAHLVLR